MDGTGRPHPFTISTITYEVVVYAPAERADTFFSTPICTLWFWKHVGEGSWIFLYFLSSSLLTLFDTSTRPLKKVKFSCMQHLRESHTVRTSRIFFLANGDLQQRE
jgi:hypothetical protein